MPTLVDHYQTRLLAATQAVTDAQAALDAARTDRDQASVDLDDATTAYAATVADLAAAGAGIGEDGTWPDAESQSGALEAALVAERVAATDVRAASYAKHKAEDEVTRHEELLDDARAVELDVSDRLAAAQVDHTEVEQWRALIAVEPFDDPAALADTVRAADVFVDARAWLGDQIPDALIDRGLARGSAALAVTARAESIVEAYHDAFDSVDGSPAAEWRTFRRNRAAIEDYVGAAEQRLATATALLTEIPNGKGVSSAQHDEIVDPAKLVDRTTSLGLIAIVDERQADIDDFDALVERIRAATLADPAVDDGDVDADALAAAETDQGTTRADLVTAFDDAEGDVAAEDIDRVLEWGTAVPGDVWTRLAWFHRATTDLNTVAGASTQLLQDYDAAETALVAAIEAAAAVTDVSDRMEDGAAAADHELAAIGGTQSMRRDGMVRGEPDDDRS